MQQSSAQTIQYVVTAAIVGLVLLLRYRSMKRARRLSLGQLWIVPAILAIAFAVTTYEYPPPTALGWVWLAVAAAIGGVIGWWRGKLMRITVDPVTHTLNQQSSPAAMLFIVLIIVARQGLRYEAASMGINILKITGLLLASALGLLSASRAERCSSARVACWPRQGRPRPCVRA